MATPDITLDDTWVTVTGPSTFSDAMFASGITVQEQPNFNNHGTAALGPDGLAVNSFYQNMAPGTAFTLMIVQSSELILLNGIANLIDPANPQFGCAPIIEGNFPVIATLQSLVSQVSALTARVAALEAQASGIQGSSAKA
jgi:hypothetical protein